MLSKILTSNQIYGLIGFGGFYWATAALAIRSVPEALLGNESRQIISFVGTFPVSYAGMRLTEAVLGINPLARVESVVIMGATATLLDGVALMWFPEIYENPELAKQDRSLAVLLSRRGAAWILWGGGALLVIALVT